MAQASSAPRPNSAGVRTAIRRRLVILRLFRPTSLATHPGDGREDDEWIADPGDDEHRQRRIRRLEHDEETDERDAVDAIHEGLPEWVPSQHDDRRPERDERERDGLEGEERRHDRHRAESGSSPRCVARAVAITRAGFRTKRRPIAAIACNPPEVTCSRTSTAASTRNAGTVVAAAA